MILCFSFVCWKTILNWNISETLIYPELRKGQWEIKELVVSDYGIQMILAQGKLRVLIPLKKNLTRKISIGERLEGTLSLNPLHLPNGPQPFDGERFLWMKGIGAKGKIKDWNSIRILPPKDLYHKMLQQMDLKKQCVKEYLAKAWLAAPKAYGILLAGWLGERKLIDPQAKSHFNLLGLAHLLAISGFHIGLLSLVLHLLWGLFPFSRAVKSWGLLVSLCSFVFLIGAQPSVLRAAASQGYQTLAQLCEARPSKSNLWCMAFMAILIYQPRWFWHPGFWLSFSASAGLLFLYRPVRQGHILKRYLLNSMKITSVATLACLPALWFYWGQLQWASLLSNLYALPLMSLILLLGLMALLPGIGIYYLELAEALVSHLFRVNEFFVNLLGNGPLLPIASPLLLSVLLLWIFSWQIYRLAQKRTWLYLSSVLVIFIGATNPYLNPLPYRLWFIDVGQGDATLIETPQGILLIDGGKSPWNLKGFLSQWIRRKGPNLSKIHREIWITHADMDHYGGLDFAQQMLLPDSIAAPLATWKSPKTQWQQMWQKWIAPQKVVRQGQNFTLGKWQINILFPDDTCVGTNPCSLVLLVKEGDQEALLMADLEAPEEDLIAQILNQNDLHPEILKTGHHGSRNSSKDLFLKSLQPERVLISAGIGNRYGHPHIELIQRLENLNIPFNHSGYSGNIFLESKNGFWKLIRPWQLGEDRSLVDDLKSFIGIQEGKILWEKPLSEISAN